MSSTIRVGVLGAAGEAAHGHIQAFMKDPRSTVVALWDTNVEGLEQRAKEFGIDGVAHSLEAFLARPDLDAVVIATPDHLHADHAEAALRAGKHVLCEKPTSTSRADAVRLVAAVRESGRVFLGGHVYHFRPDYQRMRDAYRRGDIGKAWLAEGDYVANLADMYGADGRTPWRSAADKPQDIMIGGGCHPFGLMRWMLGQEVVEVTAFSNHQAEPRLPLDDCYVAVLRYADGTIGRLTAAAGSRGKVPDGGYVKLRGTEGSLWNSQLFRDDNPYHSPHPIRDFGYETRFIGPRITKTIQMHYWAEQAEHFLDCVEGKAEPMTTVVDSARVIAGLTACVDSARTGLPVRVDNEF